MYGWMDIYMCIYISWFMPSSSQTRLELRLPQPWVVILVLISLGLNIHTIVGLVDVSPLRAPCTTDSRPHDELHEKKYVVIPLPPMKLWCLAFAPSLTLLTQGHHSPAISADTGNAVAMGSSHAPPAGRRLQTVSTKNLQQNGEPCGLSALSSHTSGSATDDDLLQH